MVIGLLRRLGVFAGVIFDAGPANCCVRNVANLVPV